MFDPKQCPHCGETFIPRTRRHTICGKKECVNARNRKYYKNNTVECVCSICGIVYAATGQQLKDKCPECAKVTKEMAYKNPYTQRIRCIRCGAIIKTVQKINFIVGWSKEDLYLGTCEKCKERIRKQQSLRMKLNNPTYGGKVLTIEEWEQIDRQRQYYQSEEYKEKRKKELSKQFSKRMKENNPMKNLETREKVSTTLKEGYESGRILKCLGKDHWSYVGGPRNIRQYLRRCITDWVKYLIQQSNYTCQECGKRGSHLHVHHCTPFIQIVEMGCQQLNIDINTVEFRDNNYQTLEQWVRDYHWGNFQVGIVVCRLCHDRIDKQYNAPKHLKEEGNT